MKFFTTLLTVSLITSPSLLEAKGRNIASYISDTQMIYHAEPILAKRLRKIEVQPTSKELDQMKEIIIKQQSLLAEYVANYKQEMGIQSNRNFRKFAISLTEGDYGVGSGNSSLRTNEEQVEQEENTRLTALYEDRQRLLQLLKPLDAAYSSKKTQLQQDRKMEKLMIGLVVGKTRSIGNYDMVPYAPYSKDEIFPPYSESEYMQDGKIVWPHSKHGSIARIVRKSK